MRVGQLEITREPDALIARLIGEIDFSNAADVGLGLESAVPKDSLGAILDLTPTSYIDSAGVRILFSLSGRMRQAGRQLRLVVPTGSPLMRVLKLTGIAMTLPVDETVPEALEALRREVPRAHKRSWVGGTDLGPWPTGGTPKPDR
jgi:anti-anti-sigma factor